MQRLNAVTTLIMALLRLRMRLTLNCLATTVMALGLVFFGWPAAAAAQATETVEYFHTDPIGSVRMVTGPQGEVLERRDFLPFGEELAPPPNAQPLGFGGKERDTETGNGSWMALNYFGARHLHTASGEVH